jgi:hypothetical protein
MLRPVSLLVAIARRSGRNNYSRHLTRQRGKSQVSAWTPSASGGSRNCASRLAPFSDCASRDVVCKRALIIESWLDVDITVVVRARSNKERDMMGFRRSRMWNYVSKVKRDAITRPVLIILQIPTDTPNFTSRGITMSSIQVWLRVRRADAYRQGI